MDIEKLVRVWRSQWEAMVGEQCATSLFEISSIDAYASLI